jgi:hypothetical protein
VTDEIDLQGDEPQDVAPGFGAIWAPIAESTILVKLKP